MTKKASYRFFFILALLFMNAPQLYAEGSPSDARSNEDLTSLPLEDLMNLKIRVASKTDNDIRRAPGVVTLITKEEIAKTGARDLVDVLRMIPDFQFGTDVQGAIGLASRGLWAQEGKTLVLWNSHVMNEYLYSTAQYGNHFPVDLIERIEIIRGPGSVLYGGYAELAVINIITKGADDLKGGQVSAAYGQTSSSFARRNITAAYGGTQGDLSASASLFLGEGIRSNRSYTDFSGSSFDMKNDSELNPRMASVDLKYKDFTAKFLADQYRAVQRDEFGKNLSEPAHTNFDAYAAALSYNYKANTKWTITPEVSYKKQYPWYEPALKALDNLVYKRYVERTTAGISSLYKPSDNFDLLMGAQYYYERAHEYDDLLFSDGSSNFSDTSAAAFLEGTLHESLFDVTLGGRYEDHDKSKSTFVPRLSIGRAFDKLYLKLLASSAFRSPSLENINANADLVNAGVPGVSLIKLESAKTLEFEASYKFSHPLFARANFFLTRIDDPISYSVDSATAAEGYRNFPQIQTYGFSSEIRYKLHEWDFRTAYALYTKSGSTEAPTYEVPGHSADLLGFARQKLTSQLTWQVTDNVSINNSIEILGDRFGYTDASGIPRKFGTTVTDDMYLLWEATKELSLGVGVYNIFNENARFIQPYTSDHAPIPSLSREFLAKATLRF